VNIKMYRLCGVGERLEPRLLGSVENLCPRVTAESRGKEWLHRVTE